MTPNPLRVVASAAETYQGRTIRDYNDVSEETARRWFTGMTRTKLAAPLELVNFHFLIEGVTRAFTHQLVRQRTAVYIQESMRFAVKEHAAFEVALPPSLVGLKPSDPRVVVWTDAVWQASEAYNNLVNSGMPAEDARGLLPTNITTRIHYGTNLRALADHAGNRLCTQAQFEWRLVWAQMIQAIRNQPKDVIDDYNRRIWKHEQWQYDLICTLFKPVCFQTGRCGFDSSADRTCSIRGRVKAHEANGEPPSEWNDIDDREWLTDPTAAR
jgi:flavin-dependent thymidylate synthase